MGAQLKSLSYEQAIETMVQIQEADPGAQSIDQGSYDVTVGRHPVHGHCVLTLSTVGNSTLVTSN